jgi:hypothetical protein
VVYRFVLAILAGEPEPRRFIAGDRETRCPNRRATMPLRPHTGDRAEFVGRNRALGAPAALFRPELEGRTGAGLDPCGALHVVLEIAPGESRRVAFVLGQGRDEGHASELAARYADVAKTCLIRDDLSVRRCLDAVFKALRPLSPLEKYRRKADGRHGGPNGRQSFLSPKVRWPSHPWRLLGELKEASGLVDASRWPDA